MEMRRRRRRTKEGPKREMRRRRRGKDRGKEPLEKERRGEGKGKQCKLQELVLVGLVGLVTSKEERERGI